ncbi:MAG: hypothetical protein DRI86_07520 [Bacteroidetes bacterium]|nr:MAG: hypothetical protein DRI86_07520 [Bacteroidota bacterium]
MKYQLKYIKWIFKAVSIIVLIFTFLILSIYIPPVQKFILSNIEAKIGQNLQASVEIESFDLSFLANINLNKLVIIRTSDTLLILDGLLIDIEFLPLLKHKVIIDELELVGLNTDIYKLIKEDDSDSIHDTPQENKEDNWEIIFKTISVTKSNISLVDTLTKMDLILDIGRLELYDLVMDSFITHAQYAVLENSKISYIAPYTVDEEIDTNIINFILSIKEIKVIRSEFYYDDNLMRFATGGEDFNITKLYVNLADEVANLHSVNLDNYYFNLLYINDTLITPESDIDWKVKCDFVNILNSSITYDISYLPEKVNVFDYNHIHLANIDGTADSIFYSFHKMWGIINTVSFIENNKFEVSSLSGEYYADDKLLRLKDIALETPENSIKVDGTTGFYVSDFTFTETEKTDIALAFDINNWDMLDYFSGGQLEDIKDIDQFRNKEINLITHIIGNTDTLYSQIDLTYNNTRLLTQGQILNLSNTEILKYDFDISKLILPKQDIALFIDKGNTIDYIPQLTVIDGKVQGSISKTSFRTNVESKYGKQNIMVDIDLSDSLPTISAKVYGNIIAESFKDLKIDTLEIDCKFTGNNIDNLIADANLVLKGVKMDTLKYKEVNMQIDIENQNYKIDIASIDNKARLKLNSTGIINDSIINSQTNLIVDNINFKENGIFESPINLKFGSQINLNFNFNNYNTYLDADIWDITTSDSMGTNYIEELNIDINYNNKYSKFNLISDNNMIKAVVHGSLDTLINNMEQFVNILVLEDESIHDSIFIPNFNIKADINKPYDIFGDEISKDWPQFSKILFSIDYEDTRSKSIKIDLFMPDLMYLNSRLDSATINVVGDRNELSYYLESNIQLDSILDTRLLIDGNYKYKKLFTHINLSDDKNNDFLNINLLSQKNDIDYLIKILDDSLILLSYDWTIDKQNNFAISEDKLIASNLVLKRANKEIIIKTDTLKHEINFKLNNIDLAVFNSVLSNDSMLAGITNIDLTTSYNSEVTNLSLEANIDKFKYDNYPIGNINLNKCLLNSSEFKFNLGIDKHSETMELTGRINLIDDNKIHIESNTHNLDLGILNKTLDMYLYDVAGSIDSRIVVSGTIDEPIIDGFIEFDEASFGFMDLNEVYTINNEKILIRSNIISAERINLLDKNKHKISFAGNIQYLNKELIFNNFSLKSDAIELMNTERHNEELVYGLIIAELEMHLNGNLKNLQAESRVIIDYPTQINYVFPEDLSVENNDDLINFTKIDTLSIIDTLLMSKIEYLNKYEMFKSLDAEFIIKKGCKFNIYFDNSFENYLNMAINGDVKYVILNNTPKTYGILNIDRGNMSYSIPMVTMDKLKVEDGSYIQITNDVENPILTINSSTKIWAQTGGLVEDYNRNLEVTIFIYMKGSLDNLVIQFDISSETDDPLISSKISQMTDKERSINAVNLLVRGQFATLQNTKTIDINSYINQILASGLNKLISDQIKFVDMSFDMQSYSNYTSSGDLESQSNLFFNVGKSFYHDRIRIKYTGSLTTNTTQQGQTYGQMESATQNNLTVGYDINKSGTLQALLFRKSGYDDLMEGEVISTGGGFRIKKTYNSFSDIFKFKKEE